jgi:hypothetical protein
MRLCVPTSELPIRALRTSSPGSFSVGLDLIREGVVFQKCQKNVLREGFCWGAAKNLRYMPVNASCVTIVTDYGPEKNDIGLRFFPLQGEKVAAKAGRCCEGLY